MLKVFIRAITKRVGSWARRRQGIDALPVTLGRRRVYILPTRFGLIYASIVFAMLLGSMNYNNSLGFALTFLLTGLGLVAMHHCHRNLTGLIIAGVQTGEAFVGETLSLQVGLENPAALRRFELAIECVGRFGNSPYPAAEALSAKREAPETAVHSVAAASRALASIELPVERRGVIQIDRIAVSTRFPFSLFRAWSWLHLPVEAIVYPKPAGVQTPPPTAVAAHAEYSGRQHLRDGTEDFRGFRSYSQGDSPRHIYWKGLARGAPLLVKEYAAASQAPTVFDFEAVLASNTEVRLSQLCRWIVDADRSSAVYGLKLPDRQIPLASGAAHRRRCLTALALFGPARSS